MPRSGLQTEKSLILSLPLKVVFSEGFFVFLSCLVNRADMQFKQQVIETVGVVLHFN